MKATLVPFNALYGLDVCSRLIDEEKVQLEAFTGTPFNMDTLLQSLLNLRGPKWAILHAERAVIVGGFIPRRPAVYETWLLSAAEAWAGNLGITGIVHGAMADMLKNGARRLETVCLEARSQTRAWYPKIGLRYEATFSQYGARGETAVMYVSTAEVAA
jgi:hypothetical protein